MFSFPDGLMGLPIDAVELAERAAAEDVFVGDGRHRPRSVESGLAGRIVGKRPEFLAAVQIQAAQHIARGVAGSGAVQNEHLLVADRRSAKAFTQRQRPEYLGAAFRPALQEPGFGRDVVALIARILRPVGQDSAGKNPHGYQTQYQRSQLHGTAPYGKNIIARHLSQLRPVSLGCDGSRAVGGLPVCTARLPSA